MCFWQVSCCHIFGRTSRPWDPPLTTQKNKIQRRQARIYVHVSNRLLLASDNMATAIDKVITIDYISVSEWNGRNCTIRRLWLVLRVYTRTWRLHQTADICRLHAEWSRVHRSYFIFTQHSSLNFTVFPFIPSSSLCVSCNSFVIIKVKTPSTHWKR